MTNPSLLSIFEAQERPKDPPVSSVATSTTAESSISTSLNITNGSAASFLDDIIRGQLKNEGKRAQIRKRKEQEETTKRKFDKIRDITSTKRLTSGILMKEGQLHLSEDLLAQALEEKKAKEDDKERKAQEKEARIQKREEELKAAMGKHARGDKLRAAELKVLLRHVHRETDADLPTKAEELRILWDERKGRLPTMYPV